MPLSWGCGHRERYVRGVCLHAALGGLPRTLNATLVPTMRFRSGNMSKPCLIRLTYLFRFLFPLLEGLPSSTSQHHRINIVRRGGVPGRRPARWSDRWAGRDSRGFSLRSRKRLCYIECPRLRESNSAGWSSLVARRAHNPKVTGSNPVPATNEIAEFRLAGAPRFSLVGP